jgi:hypothetical protein
MAGQHLMGLCDFYEGRTPYFTFTVITPEELDQSAAEPLNRIRNEAAKALLAPTEWILSPHHYTDPYHFEFQHLPTGFILCRKDSVIRMMHTYETVTFDPELGVSGGLDHRVLADKIPSLWEELKDLVIIEERSRQLTKQFNLYENVLKNIERTRNRFYNPEPPVPRKRSLWSRIKAQFR